jgi:hypothetical protein
MKKFIIFILFAFACEPINTPVQQQSSESSELSLIDTAYVDPVSGHIKPPCSMSPNYCECMKSRGADITCEGN